MYTNLGSTVKITELHEIVQRKKFRFSLRIANFLGYVEDVTLVFQKYHSPQRLEFPLSYITSKKEVSTFLTDPISFDFGIGLYFYCYRLKLNNQLFYVKFGKNGIELTHEDLPWLQFTVTKKRFQVPQWAKGSIMFHIMVDRFARDMNLQVFEMVRRTIHDNWNELPVWKPDQNGEITNTDFFCGNLKGITKHLKYIKKLGVKIIYLSPVCRSQSNHRYDTADYMTIDPYLGSEEDMKELCNRAHRLGMRVIIDTVFNHTGDDSIYFNRYHTFPEPGAIDGSASKYFNWFKKNDLGMFRYWWNFTNLPVCNPECKEWRNYLFGSKGVIETWFNWGIDGLRIDVADELPDWFLTELYECAHHYNRAVFVLGEVWENAIRKDDGNRNYLLGTSLHSVMNYPFTNAVLQYVRFHDKDILNRTLNEIYLDYPREALLSTMNSISTHDIPRAITTLTGIGFMHNRYQWVWDFGEKSREWQAENDQNFSSRDYKRGRALFQAAMCIMYFFPGNPCIYYGDEVGLYGYKDPWNRKTYPWKYRDKKLLRFCRKLGKVHNSLRNLDKARLRTYLVTEDYIIYERTWKKSRTLVAVNISEKSIPITIPNKYKNDPVVFAHNHSTQHYLAPFGCIVLSNCQQRVLHLGPLSFYNICYL